jgi:hypothetical protein
MNPTAPQQPLPPPRKPRGPAIGAEGSKAAALRFTNSIQFPFGIFDEVALEPPAHQRYVLLADDITLTEIGAVVSIRPALNRPPTVLIPWVAISYVYPPAPLKDGE